MQKIERMRVPLGFGKDYDEELLQRLFSLFNFSITSPHLLFRSYSAQGFVFFNLVTRVTQLLKSVPEGEMHLVLELLVADIARLRGEGWVSELGSIFFS